MSRNKPTKPKKPRKDFPLTAHPNGQWCKKIKGKVHFFGLWADPDAALAKYLDEKDDLQAGRTPRRASGAPTTADIVNLFLKRSDDRVQAGELSAVSFNDYRIIGKLIVEHLGRTTDPAQLRPADFAAFRLALVKRYAPSRLSKTVAVTRMILKWAFESEHIEAMPRFGPDFSVAGKKTHRLHKTQMGPKLLSREDAHALLSAADAQWRAILLLCLNGGLGNSDISRIKLSDVGGEWLDLPRGKTGVERHIPLWKETQKAIQEAIRERPKPKPEAADLLFLSKHGNALIRVREDGKKTDLTVEGFRRLAKSAGIWKPRMGLYWCRHTFQTVGDQEKDPIATSAIMGHIDASMAGNYRQTIDDSRLRSVTEHVRNWLYGHVEEGSRPVLRVVG